MARLTGSPDIKWNILTGCQLNMEHLDPASLTTQNAQLTSTSIQDPLDGRLTGSPDIGWNILTGLTMEHLEGFDPAIRCPYNLGNSR